MRKAWSGLFNSRRVGTAHRLVDSFVATLIAKHHIKEAICTRHRWAVPTLHAAAVKIRRRRLVQGGCWKYNCG